MQTVDTDVVVLLIGYMHLMRNIDVIAHHGVGKNVFFTTSERTLTSSETIAVEPYPFNMLFQVATRHPVSSKLESVVGLMVG